MKTPALLFCLLLTISAVSQTSLVGTITDADTGEPVVFATVSLFQNNVLKTSSQADFEGYYSISEIEPGRYDVKFSFTGYAETNVKDLLILIDKRARLDVKMDEGSAILTNCIITICPPVVDQSDMTQGMRFSSHEIKRAPFRW